MYCDCHSSKSNMVSKVLILVLLGSSLALADSSRREVIITKESVEQQWIGKVVELLGRVDRTSSKCYHKAQSKLLTVVNALRQKDNEAAATAEGRWTKLKEEYPGIKNKIIDAIRKEKMCFLDEIEKIEGEITKSQLGDINMKENHILAKENVKSQTELRIWNEKVETVRNEALEILKEIQFQEVLNECQRKYGEIYEANKVKLIELKEEYQQTVRQAQLAIEQQTKVLLEHNKDEPEEDQELKIKAHREISAEVAKWNLLKDEIKQEIYEVIQDMKEQLTHQPIH